MSDNFYLKEKAFTILKLNLTAPIFKSLKKLYQVYEIKGCNQWDRHTV